MLNYLEGINKTSTETLEDLFDQYSFGLFHSNAGIRRDLYGRDAAQVRLTEFFGGVTTVEVSQLGSPPHLDKDAEKRSSGIFKPAQQPARKSPQAAVQSAPRQTALDDLHCVTEGASLSVTSVGLLLMVLAGHIAAWLPLAGRPVSS